MIVGHNASSWKNLPVVVVVVATSSFGGADLQARATLINKMI